MYRHNIPLIPQEDLAYALGLTVPKKDAYLFGKVRTGKKPTAGWGTQIRDPRFDINKVLLQLDIPLTVTFHTLDELITENELCSLLRGVDASDALVCFDYGVLWQTDFRGGHVCVLDRIEGDDVWLVDPERNVPKHRKVSLKQLYKAIDFHGAQNSAGVWEIKIR